MKRNVISRSALAGCAIAAGVSGVAVHAAGGASWSPGAGATASQAIDKRYEGEFGLYVRVVPKGLEVRWLTRDEEVGVVRVRGEVGVMLEEKTPRDTAHAAVLEVTKPIVTLEYGGLESGRLFRTEISREPPEVAPVDLEAPDSIYVFGDVHGQFDRIVSLLLEAGLIDDELRWQGGTSNVAFLGDIFDRGPDVTGVLWLLYRLEREAAEAGGRVLVVLGNHELMIMSGDLRYVHGGEAAIGFRHRVRYEDLFHPTESVLGRWLASKPGLLRLGDMLFAHGGVSPRYVDYSLRDFRDTLSSFIREELFTHWNDDEFLRAFARRTTLDSAAVGRRYDFFFGRQSVFWYRDLILTDTLDAFVDRVLDEYDVALHVVAHTPGETIHERYEGDLIAVDLLDAASELLLLVREEEGWSRYKLPIEGDLVPLGPPPAETG